MLLYKRVECPLKTGHRDTRSQAHTISRTWLLTLTPGCNWDVITDPPDHLHTWFTHSSDDCFINSFSYVMPLTPMSLWFRHHVTKEAHFHKSALLLDISPRTFEAVVKLSTKPFPLNYVLNWTYQGFVIHSAWTLVCCFWDRLVIMRVIQHAAVQITTCALAWLIPLKGEGINWRHLQTERERVEWLLLSHVTKTIHFMANKACFHANAASAWPYLMKTQKPFFGGYFYSKTSIVNTASIFSMSGNL